MSEDREIRYKKHLYLLWVMYPKLHGFLDAYLGLPIPSNNPKSVNFYGNIMILLKWISRKNYEQLEGLGKMLDRLPEKDFLYTNYDDSLIDWGSGLKEESEKYIRQIDLLYEDAGRPTPDLGKEANKIIEIGDRWIQGLKDLSKGQDRFFDISTQNFGVKHKYVSYKNDEGYEVLEYPERQWSLILDMDGGRAKICHKGNIIYSMKQDTGTFKQFLLLWKNEGKTVSYQKLFESSHDGDNYGSGYEVTKKRKTIKKDFDRISNELAEVDWDIVISFEDGVALNLY